MKKQSFFTRVDYRQFRQFMQQLGGHHIKNRGYETEIYDSHGDLQAIIQAASIDEQGRCHPASYHVHQVASCVPFSVAA